MNKILFNQKVILVSVKSLNLVSTIVNFFLIKKQIVVISILQYSSNTQSYSHTFENMICQYQLYKRDILALNFHHNGYFVDNPTALMKRLNYDISNCSPNASFLLQLVYEYLHCLFKQLKCFIECVVSYINYLSCTHKIIFCWNGTYYIALAVMNGFLSCHFLIYNHIILMNKLF